MREAAGPWADMVRRDIPIEIRFCSLEAFPAVFATTAILNAETGPAFTRIRRSQEASFGVENCSGGKNGGDASEQNCFIGKNLWINYIDNGLRTLAHPAAPCRTLALVPFPSVLTTPPAGLAVGRGDRMAVGAKGFLCAQTPVSRRFDFFALGGE